MHAVARTRFARDLRQRMTDAENTLWFRLRRKALGGRRFRRQHPLGPYVVDFACLDARLVVELDGSQHLLARSDVTRDAFLVRRGFRVLRFWNDDVLLRLEEVLEAIRLALEDEGPDQRRFPLRS